MLVRIWSTPCCSGTEPMTMINVPAMPRRRTRCRQCREMGKELKAVQLELRRISLRHKLSLNDRIRELRNWQDARDEVRRRLAAHKESHRRVARPFDALAR